MDLVIFRLKMEGLSSLHILCIKSWDKGKIHPKEKNEETSSHCFTAVFRSLRQKLWNLCSPTREQERFLIQALFLLSRRNILGHCSQWLLAHVPGGSSLFIILLGSIWRRGDKGRKHALLEGYSQSLKSVSWSWKAGGPTCFTCWTKVLSVKAHGFSVNIILSIT